jgi:hypothetical protein
MAEYEKVATTSDVAVAREGFSALAWAGIALLGAAAIAIGAVGLGMSLLSIHNFNDATLSGDVIGPLTQNTLATVNPGGDITCAFGFTNTNFTRTSKGLTLGGQCVAIAEPNGSIVLSGVVNGPANNNVLVQINAVNVSCPTNFTLSGGIYLQDGRVYMGPNGQCVPIVIDNDTLPDLNPSTLSCPGGFVAVGQVISTKGFTYQNTQCISSQAFGAVTGPFNALSIVTVNVAPPNCANGQVVVNPVFIGTGQLVGGTCAYINQTLPIINPSGSPTCDTNSILVAGNITQVGLSTNPHCVTPLFNTTLFSGGAYGLYNNLTLNITGTTNEIIVTQLYGDGVVLSTPQPICTTCNPTFNTLALASPLSPLNGGTGDNQAPPDGWVPIGSAGVYIPGAIQGVPGQISVALNAGAILIGFAGNGSNGSATAITPANGGTGLSVTPSFGQFLMGVNVTNNAYLLVSFIANDGVTISYTNTTVTFATVQGIATSDSPSFAGLTLTITPLAPGSGGTGSNAVPSNGQIPAGSGGVYTPTSITGSGGIVVTLGAGLIALSLQQNLTNTSNPTFNSIALTNPLAIIYGGTGLSTLPGLTQVLVGNGTNYNLLTVASVANQTTVTQTSTQLLIGTVQNIGTLSSPTFYGLTITTGLQPASGGTGTTTVPSDGQLLIASGGVYVPAFLQGQTGEINIFSSAGSILIALAQGVNTTSTPTFLNLTLTQPLLPASGGTGTNSTPGLGSILWGDGSGVYKVMTLQGTANEVIITNTSSAVVLSTPQPIGTSSDVTFRSATLSVPLSYTSGGLGVATLPVSGSFPISNGTGYQFGNIQGTDQEIIVTYTGGNYILSLFQGESNTSNPTFNSLTLTNPLGLNSGGTGLNISNPANGAILIGNGTALVLNTITGTANQITVTNGPGTITLSFPSAVTITTLTLTNPLTVPNGGTGLSSIPINNILIATSANTLSARLLTVGPNGIVYTLNSSQVNLDLSQGLNPTSSPTFASLTLTSALTVANGGTGLSSIPINNILFASAANTLSARLLTVGPNGIVLTVNSTEVNLDMSQGLNTMSSPTFAAVTLTVTPLQISSGGTGLTTIPINNILIATAANVLSARLLTVGPNGLVLTVNSTEVNLDLSQAIGPSSSPTFNSLTLTNPLTVPNGGTGLSSIPINNILIATAANTLGARLFTVGPNGIVLTVNSSEVNLDMSQALNTVSSPTFAGLTLTTTPLQVGSGGTGLSSIAINNILIATAANTLGARLLTVGPNGIVLTFNSSQVNLDMSQALNTGSSPTFAGLTLSTTPLGASSGGTSFSGSSANGQLLIGNAVGWARATLTAGTGVSIVNGAGTITISTTGTVESSALANGNIWVGNSSNLATPLLLTVGPSLALILNTTQANLDAIQCITTACSPSFTNLLVTGGKISLGPSSFAFYSNAATQYVQTIGASYNTAQQSVQSVSGSNIPWSWLYTTNQYWLQYADVVTTNGNYTMLNAVRLRTANETTTDFQAQFVHDTDVLLYGGSKLEPNITLYTTNGSAGQQNYAPGMQIVATAPGDMAIFFDGFFDEISGIGSGAGGFATAPVGTEPVALLKSGSNIVIMGWPNTGGINSSLGGTSAGTAIAQFGRTTGLELTTPLATAYGGTGTGSLPLLNQVPIGVGGAGNPLAYRTLEAGANGVTISVTSSIIDIDLVQCINTTCSPTFGGATLGLSGQTQSTAGLLNMVGVDGVFNSQAAMLNFYTNSSSTERPYIQLFAQGSTSQIISLGCGYNSSGVLVSSTTNGNMLLTSVLGILQISVGHNNAVGSSIASTVIAAFQANGDTGAVTLPVSTTTPTIALTATTNQMNIGAGGHQIVISSTAPAAASLTYTMPDFGASANFVFTSSATPSAPSWSSITLTATTNQLTLGAAAHVAIISATAPAAASQTYTIPDFGGAASVVLTSNTVTTIKSATYTPVIGITGSTNFVTSIADGHYSTIGDRIIADIFIQWTSTNSANNASAATFTLPVTPLSSTNYRSVCTVGYTSGVSWSGQISVLIVDNQLNAQLLSTTSAGTSTQLLVSQLYPAGIIVVSCTYRTT